MGRTTVVGGLAVLVALGLWAAGLGSSGADGAARGAENDAPPPLMGLQPVARTESLPESARADSQPLVAEAPPVEIAGRVVTVGRLVDGRGVPVAGVEVRAVPVAQLDVTPGRGIDEPWWTDGGGVVSHSDAEGRFEVVWPDSQVDGAPSGDDAPRGLILATALGADGSFSDLPDGRTVGAVAFGRPGDLGDVRLDPARAQQVTVLAEHQPVPGAPVALRLLLDENHALFSSSYGARSEPTERAWFAFDMLAHTDRDGVAVLPPIPERVRASLLARVDGYAPAHDLSPWDRRPVELRLERPRPVVGRVVDPEGRGVAGARVTLTPFEDARALGCGTGRLGAVRIPDVVPGWVVQRERNLLARHVITGPDGAYAFDGMDGREARLLVTHPGFVAESWDHRTTEGGLLPLSRDAVVDVTVLGVDGEPTTAREVRAWSLKDDDALEFGALGELGDPLAVSATETGWRVHRTDGEGLVVRARGAGGVAQQVVAPGAGVRTVQLTPQPGLTRRVRMLDEVGQPLDLGPYDFTGAERVDRSPVQARQTPDGVYVFEDLLPGSGWLGPVDDADLAALDHAPPRLESARLEVTADGPEQVDLATVPRALLRITLDGPDLHAEGEYVKLQKLGSRYSPTRRTDGGLAVFLVDPGTYEVSVRKQVVAQVDLGPDEVHEETVSLRPWPRVRGSLHRGGRPVAGVLVEKAETDADGRFDAVVTRIGDLALTLYHPGEPGLGPWRLLHSVSLGHGDVVELDLDLDTLSGQVSASVVDASGAPAAGRNVWAQRRGTRGFGTEANGVTDAAGRVVFPALLPGEYRLGLDPSLTDGTAGAVSEPFDVDLGARVVREPLVLRPCTSLSGSVRTALGKRVNVMRVVATHSDGTQVEDHVTSGRFELLDLTPGRWSVALKGYGEDAVPLDAVVLREGESLRRDFVVPE